MASAVSLWNQEPQSVQFPVVDFKQELLTPFLCGQFLCAWRPCHRVDTYRGGSSRRKHNLGQKFMERRALAHFFPIAYCIVRTPRSPLSMLVFNVSAINIVMSWGRTTILCRLKPNIGWGERGETHFRKTNVQAFYWFWPRLYTAVKDVLRANSNDVFRFSANSKSTCSEVREIWACLVSWLADTNL